MPKHRFYLQPELWGTGSTCQLVEDEAHHCRDVMRCSVGDCVILFDGKGQQREAVITKVSKRSVDLETQTEQQTERLPAHITLGQAVPKGKNMDLIIQKATELGISRIVPIISTNTVVKVKPTEMQKKQAKWQRIAIEACKQCGQNWLPEVTEPQTVTEYIGAQPNDAFNIVAAIDPKSLPFKQIIAKARPNSVGSPTQQCLVASILIGPEGDLTETEVQTALEAEFHPMSLGPIILRSETAAIYALSLLVYELMDR